MNHTWMGKAAVVGVCISLGLASAVAQTPLQNIDMPQGGHIVYGAVDGANDQRGAFMTLLHAMHQNCGERPQIGQVFKLRASGAGSEALGLYFTVTNHPGGNVPVAGVIIAAASGHGRQEAALLSDQASRFGSTFQPMLAKLFASWHAAGLPPATPVKAGAAKPGAVHSLPSDARPSNAAFRLHAVTNSDNSASMQIAEGWTLSPMSRTGVILVKGPNGEQVGMHMIRQAVDSSNPWQMRQGMHGLAGIPGEVVAPFRGDLKNSFTTIVQAWRRASQEPPAQIKVESLEAVASEKSGNCVHERGQFDPDGKGMQTMDAFMCATQPSQIGAYLVELNLVLMPPAVAEKESGLVAAMTGSFKINQQVYEAELAAMQQQQDAATRAAVAQSRREIDRIHSIGAATTARINASHAASDAQHAGYWADQTNKAKYNQGEDNYIRDQTVIRDNQYPDEHVTVWNTTANWLQQTFPGRVEEVPTAQYIQGMDF